MIWQKANELSESGTSFVTVTMTDVRGSAPQDVGAKMIVTEQGLAAGTVGGGKVEAAAIARAQEMLQSDHKLAPISITWNLQRDIKMTCGGEVSFLFEHFPASNWPIVIFGAGHVSQALARALSHLECQVSVVDDRAEWLDRLSDVKVKTIQSTEHAKVVSQFNSKTFFLSITKGHAFDVPFLYQVWKQFPNCAYVGAIGSQAKYSAIKKDLCELGVDESFCQKLRVPMGLPIGNNSPEEIAISIIAELLQVRDALD